VSAQSHHSFLKAARLCGIGTDALREIGVGEDLTMDTELLRSRIAADRAAGCLPFMIVATGGSTGAGAVDPIAAIAEIARGESLWLHTDAAWGGAAVFLEELRGALAGIELSDSITFDAHKWLSVPMGAGIYLTRHTGTLEKTFRVTADYMPKEASSLDVTDTYAHSIQWSRRFIGLKVFLSLLVAGWEGYASVIRHQTAMGNLLRKELASNRWTILNTTPLPVVCFADSAAGDSGPTVQRLCDRVVGSGKAWISTVRLTSDRTALRACITNYATSENDVRALVQLLNGERSKLMSQG
jgi:glutamate/tyrosine decarboxylase-like PLP-dependent enzyme